jgi:hypothetical protein
MDYPIQIANGTSPVIVRSEDPMFSILQIVIPVIATGLIAYFTIRFSQKQHQRNALTEVFQMLNKSEHKDAESALIANFRGERILTPSFLEDYSNIVCRDYDQLGLFASRRGLIPKKDDVMEMFGTLIVLSHLVLFQRINNRRQSQESYYMINFTKFAIECYDYWKTKQHIPRHPLTNQPITEDEIKRWKDSLPKK